MPTKKPPLGKGPEEDIEARRAHVVAMYQAGHKMKDIAAETGFPQGTLYWVLRRAGIKPGRYAQGDEAENAPSFDEVLTQLRMSEREVGRLRDRCERQELLIEELFGRLGEKPTKNGARTPVRPATPRTRPQSRGSVG